MTRQTRELSSPSRRMPRPGIPVIADDSHAKFAFLFGAEEMVFACGMVVGYETGLGAEVAAIQAHTQVCSCARGGADPGSDSSD